MGGGYGVGLMADEEHQKKLVLFFTKRLSVNSKENSNLVWKKKSGGRNTDVTF